MTQAEFDRRLRPQLHRAGVYSFEPHEVCRVGRTTGSPAVALQAPDALLLPNIIPTLVRAERLRALVREQVPGAIMVINSAYRDPAYNAAVGSTPGSLHVQFNAIDFRMVVRRAPGADLVPALSPKDWYRMLDAFADREAFGLGLYDTFVHLDTRGYIGLPAPARW